MVLNCEFLPGHILLCARRFATSLGKETRLQRAYSNREAAMRSLIGLGIGLAAIATADGVLAQNNTLVLRRGAPPTVVPVPLGPNYGWMDGTPGQFAPAQRRAYQMPNGRYVIINGSPLVQPSPVPGYPVPGTPGYPAPGIRGR